MSAVRPPRILLVDDEGNFRELLALLLRADLGAEIVGHASDGAVGVQLAEELRPDFVVMDLRMPAIDGFEATRRIATSVPETQVVIVSSSSETDDIDRASEAGAAAYLSKDRAVSELAQALERLAERERERAGPRRPLGVPVARRLVLS